MNEVRVWWWLVMVIKVSIEAAGWGGGVAAAAESADVNMVPVAMSEAGQAGVRVSADGRGYRTMSRRCAFAFGVAVRA